MAKEGSSAKFGVAVFKASILSALVLRGPLAKVGSSAKFCVVVCKSSLLWYWGFIGQSRFICQFCVVVYKLSLLWYWGGHWPKKVHLPSFV